MVVSGEDFLKVGIEGKDRLIVSEALDGGGGVWADSRERLEFHTIVWENSVILFGDYFRRFQHISSPRIVTESFIVLEKLLIIARCERINGRKSSEYSLIVANPTTDLCLLEEDFREPDMIAEVFCR